MSADAARLAIGYGAVLGLVIATAMFLAFGVFDIQCRNNPAGQSWNAQDQHCEASQ